MIRKLYFFDVDHTITQGSTGRHFAQAARRSGLLKLRHLALIPYSYAQYRLGSGGLSIFERDFPIMRGVHRSQLEKIGREVYERSISKAVRQSMHSLIRSIQASGGKVVLATSSLDFIVQPLAEALGADAVLATQLEYSEERCTGRLAGKPVFGPYKRDAALAYAGQLGVKLSECAFYSDSIHDLPLLLEVGDPVAVAPDRRLKREARNRGWSILRPKA